MFRVCGCEDLRHLGFRGIEVRIYRVQRCLAFRGVGFRV